MGERRRPYACSSQDGRMRARVKTAAQARTHMREEEGHLGVRGLKLGKISREVKAELEHPHARQQLCKHVTHCHHLAVLPISHAALHPSALSLRPQRPKARDLPRAAAARAFDAVHPEEVEDDELLAPRHLEDARPILFALPLLQPTP